MISMENIKEYANKVIIVVLAMFLVFAMNISLDTNLWLVNSFKGNDIFCIIQFIIYIYFLSLVSNIKDKRLSIIAVIISILFALFQAIGYTVNNYEMFFETLFTNHYLIKLVIKFLGYVIMFYSIIILIYTSMSKHVKGINVDIKVPKIKNSGKDNIKLMLIFTIIIFTAYIPYLVQDSPGILSFDSANEIGQAMGIETLNDAHPLLHVLLVFIPMTIGRWIGNYNVGVALFSIMQMVIMSIIFAFTLVYIKNKGAPKVFIFLSLAFFALYPVNALFSITMWKDVMFALAVLLLAICLFELITNTDSFITSKRKNILFVLSLLAVMLFRHNGFYVIILLIPFLFMIPKQYYKRLIVIIAVTIVIISGYKFVCYNIADIPKGNSVETISVLVQQVARTVKYEYDMLSYEDKQGISKFFDIDRVGQLYEPYISDPVKGNFNNKYYDENKGEFFKLWFNLLLKHPAQFIEAFLYNNYGYWYPETWNFIVIKGFSSPEHQTLKKLEIKSESLVDSSIVKNLGDITEMRNIPITSFMFSVGFSFWILVVLLGYNIYMRNVRNVLVFLPCILVWLTILASPVFCEYRYIYSLFVCIPLFVSTIYVKKFNQNKQKALL